MPAKNNLDILDLAYLLSPTGSRAMGLRSALESGGVLTERSSPSGTPAPPAAWPRGGTAASEGPGYRLCSSPREHVKTQLVVDLRERK